MHFLNLYLRRKEILQIIFRYCVEIPAKNQPLLNYLWDISRDWLRLQRATTLHGRLPLVVFELTCMRQGLETRRTHINSIHIQR